MAVSNNERPCSICSEEAKLYSIYNKKDVLFCSIQCHEKYNEKAEVANFLLVQLKQDETTDGKQSNTNDKSKEESSKVVSEIFQACHRGDDSHEKLFGLLRSGQAVEQMNDKGETLMTYSIVKGDMKTLYVLLGAGADMNEADDNTLTPLMVAVSIEAEQKVSFLLERGADVAVQDKEGKTALHKTETNKNQQCARSLLEKDPSVIAIKDKFEQTPAHVVAGEGNDVVLTVLLEHGANLADTDNLGRTPLHCSIIQKAEKCVSLLLDHEESNNILDIADRFGFCAIHYAIQANNIDIVCALIEKGCETDKRDNKDQTALLCAASCGYTNICKILLDKCKDKNAVDSEGNSALHHAAAQGDTEMCELLIQNGADIDLCDKKQQTCIYRAASNAKAETVKMLIGKGAKCGSSVKDIQGRTPLHHAAEKGHTQVLDELLSVDHVFNDTSLTEKQPFNLLDKNNDSVLFLAASHEHKDCCQLLIDRGVTIDDASRRFLITMGLVEEKVTEERKSEEESSSRQRYAADQTPPTDSETIDDLAIGNVTSPEEVINSSRHVCEESKKQSRKSTPTSLSSSSGSEVDKWKDMIRAKRKNQQQLKARRLNKYAGHENSPYLQSMLTEDILHKNRRYLGIRPAYLRRTHHDLESNSSTSNDDLVGSLTNKTPSTHGKKYSYSGT